ncbi:MAG: hypothetical protein ABIU30_05760 [Ferruginibacter sp.]
MAVLVPNSYPLAILLPAGEFTNENTAKKKTTSNFQLVASGGIGRQIILWKAAVNCSLPELSMIYL